MHTTFTTAFATTTAYAVVSGVASASVMHAFTMWTSPVTKNANKRHSRRPNGVVN